MNGTARATGNAGWTPRGPISRDMLNNVARLREFADRLEGDERAEANAIATAIVMDIERVEGLENRRVG